MDRGIPHLLTPNSKDQRQHFLVGIGLQRNTTGTVLAPMLFVIYINDMPQMGSSMIHLFADDTEIRRPVGKLEEHDALQEDLSHLEKWSDT